jgi:hypothetical protein
MTMAVFREIIKIPFPANFFSAYCPISCSSLAESELSNIVLFVLCRLHQQQLRHDGTSPTVLVAGNSMVSLRIVLWLVVSPNE